VARPFGAILDDGLVAAAEILGRAAGVAEEKHVHHAALGDAGDVLVEFRRAVVGITDPRARHAPEIIGMKKGNVGGEMDVTGFGQGGVSSSCARF
jgi:hypothetical protein